MTYFKNIYWYFLCFVSYTIKGLELANIYVLDLPSDGDDVALLKNYDDYDPITEFAYDDRNTRQRIYKTVDPQKTTHVKVDPDVVLCQRLFGSMFGNENKHIRCLQALKTNTRSHEYAYFKPTRKRKRQSTKHDKFVRQDSSFLDLTKFSQDYLDIKDLGRSEGFASDYVDVEDFKTSRALPNCNELDVTILDGYTNVDCLPSRKSAIGRNNKNFFRRLRTKNKNPDSSSSESVDEVKVTRSKPKPKKRYKVISNEDSETSSSNDSSESEENNRMAKNKDVRSEDGNPNTPDKSTASENDESESESAKESSVEVTTKKYKKKPKVKSKKLGRIEDRYVYLQGNRVYNTDDFRRRMPHFLPKRFHWNHDDYHKLGYYWFNGPRGEYKN